MGEPSKNSQLLETYDCFVESSDTLWPVWHKPLTKAFDTYPLDWQNVRVVTHNGTETVMTHESLRVLEGIVADFRNTDTMPEDYVLDLYTLDPERPRFAVEAIRQYLDQDHSESPA